MAPLIKNAVDLLSTFISLRGLINFYDKKYMSNLSMQLRLGNRQFKEANSKYRDKDKYNISYNCMFIMYDYCREHKAVKNH